LTTTTIARPGEPIPAEGFPFTVNVVLSVAEPFELSAFQASVRFNGTLMNCTSATMNKTDPSFVFFGKSPITVSPQIVVLQGVFYAFWGATLLEPISVSAGQYLLGRVNFTASKLANSTLQIIPVAEGDPEYPDAAFLLDADLHDVAFSFENCQVTATVAEGEESPPNAEFSFRPTANFTIDQVPLNQPAGKRYDRTLNVVDASDVRFWIANITYNNTVLKATDVYEGLFLQSVGSTTFASTIDQGTGSVQLSCSLLDSGSANDTTKPLATIAFEVISGIGAGQLTVARAETRPLGVAFDASASFDPDGTIQAYQWDFGDNTTSEGLKVMHAFNLSGSYPVTLTVFDNDGLNGSVTHTVEIGAVPFVNFTFSRAGESELDPVTFNASLSYDPDGIIVSYIWLFGDETNQTETNETTITHQYIFRGVYTANLTIIDNEGLHNSSTVTITVGRRPIPNFFPDPELRLTPEELEELGGALEELKINASYGPFDPGPYGIYGQNDTVGFDASTSAIGEEGREAEIFIALYVWDFGDFADQVIVNASDPSTFNGSQPFLASHMFGVGGGFDVNLTIYDNDGLSASIVKAIQTSGEAAPWQRSSNTLYYAVAGAVFAVVVVGAIVIKKRQKPEFARKEKYRVI
jgi:PKD repeat protein